MKETSIFINQIGYLPQDIKKVFVAENTAKAGDTFEVCNAKSAAVIYSGQLKNSLADGGVDAAAGELVFSGDFSSVNQPGEYLVRVNGNESFKFKIAQDVYNNLYYSLLKYFNLSRCGQGICHTDVAEVYGTGEKKNVQGGWHDAGDYGRYVVAGTKTVMDLLLAYDAAGAKFKDFDILAEVRFELEWLLQLQREDGGVYHKISCYHFCGFINPEDEKDALVLAPVSTAATADFAGCLAYSAAYFEASDSKFAEKLIGAARKAQVYLDSHEDQLYINPPEITTGGYGDRTVIDERYFALCGLWAATGEKEYLEKAAKTRAEGKARIPDPANPWDKGWMEAFGWGLVSGYGTEILLKNEKLIEDKALVEEIKTGIINQAEGILERAAASAFNYDSKWIGWGSNGAICDIAHILIIAFRLTGKAEYFNTARAQINYVLGCNPVNYCYVTGAGTKSPVNPHHRPSGASGKVMAGMLVGGPSAGLQDEYAKKNLAGLPPLKCYADAMPSYSTNEVAIYWNSALVYLMANCCFK